MDPEPLQLAKTVEARLEKSVDARTIVENPHATIEPARLPSPGAVAALDALRALGASLADKIDVHRTLGEGGMGVVHLATQSTLGRHVAVKTLRNGVGDEEAALRILREAWITGALEHPNIVPVHDVGVDATGAPVIVMKRIEGQEWSHLLRDAADVSRRFAVTDVLEWHLRTLASVCNAVHFAHSRGILHRDLKPDNVMIGEFGEVYVLDWGIAVSLKDDPSGRLPSAAQAIDIAGTPQYMAPEMLLGDPSAYSPRTDVYLLGAIFYEIFAGEPPHKGADVHAIVTGILLSSPTFPSNFPAEAKRICIRALSRDPLGRFESAQEFRLAIDEYLRHRGSRKLANDAKQSLVRLQEALESDLGGEERKLAVANLLGESRFGYHAALSAWPGNEAARQGLDRALLLVIDHELKEESPATAATLLREVSAPPPEVTARVMAALTARDLEDDRRRTLEENFDPRVGSRTRTLLTVMFGSLWTLTPALGLFYGDRRGRLIELSTMVLPSVVFLVLGLGAFRWARFTLTRTALNRRIAGTFGLFLVAQTVLGMGGWLSHMEPGRMHVLFIFSWSLTFVVLGLWTEVWLFVPAAICAVTFLLASALPRATYPLMSLDNLVFTLVMVKVWYPKEGVRRVSSRQLELQSREARWLDGRRRPRP